MFRKKKKPRDSDICDDGEHVWKQDGKYFFLSRDPRFHRKQYRSWIEEIEI